MSTGFCMYQKVRENGVVQSEDPSLENEGSLF